MESVHHLCLYFDGLCEPNPGGVPCYGWALKTVEGATLHRGHGVVTGSDPKTNNTAEWAALLEGITFAKGMPLERLSIRGDSQLVINQLNGTWAAKKPHLARYRDQCQSLLRDILWDASWIPREQNNETDELSRVAFEVAK